MTPAKMMTSRKPSFAPIGVGKYPTCEYQTFELSYEEVQHLRSDCFRYHGETDKGDACAEKFDCLKNRAAPDGLENAGTAVRGVGGRDDRVDEVVRTDILLSIDAKGNVTSRNVGVTFDIFGAEAHKA
jgi:hypothetical protein